MKLCLVCNFQFSDDQDLCPKDLSKLVPVGKDPLIGMLIQDRYRIESLIAKGSMGVIYRATQESIGRAVAIKVMHGYLVNDIESRKRFQKEAKAASRLNHPNITTVYDFGVLASGQPYIVMDLLSGKALADILLQRGQLNMGQTLMVFKQVCQALGEAHAHGVVHRDIKPENIVIDELPDGKSINVKVVDFGIATFAAGEDETIGKITKTGTVCGSPFYMSPEQCDGGKVDQRSDLYSLGIVLFECLTGKVPFESKDIYLCLAMQVKDTPPRLSKVRPDLEFSLEIEMLVAKALSKVPEARFQTAREFWQALAATAGAKADARSQSTEELSNQFIFSTGNSSRPAEETIDPELLRRKVQEATGYLQEKAERAQAERQSRRLKKVQTVTTVDRVISVVQIVRPFLLTLFITIALFWVIANQTIIHTFISKNIGNRPGSVLRPPLNAKPDNALEKTKVATLIDEDKLEEAKAILDSRKKDGSLKEDDQDDMDRLCVKLARKEAKARHFKQAIVYLDQVSAETRDKDEVKALFKKYRKLVK